MPIGDIDHRIIREFVAHMYDRRLERTTSRGTGVPAVVLQILFPRRPGSTRNLARLGATPKLPKRIPACRPPRKWPGSWITSSRPRAQAPRRSDPRSLRSQRRAAAAETRSCRSEPLYAAGFRVSELTGLNLGDIDDRKQILRVLGKGRKERIVPFGAKALEALASYWPMRDPIRAAWPAARRSRAVFLDMRGPRRESRTVAPS